MDEPTRDDAVVIGGGPAGLNGALMLARSRRSVLVIDEGSPRNSPAEAVHGLLGHDGTPPRELMARGRSEVERYGGRVLTGEVAGAERNGDSFSVTLTGDKVVHGRRLLVTTGVVDELPDVPGLRERWGRDVLHCPYCHGWEVRDKAIGVLGGGPRSVHLALLFRQLSNDVVYFSNDAPSDPDDAKRLEARDIRIAGGKVVSLEIEGDQLAGMRLQSGEVVSRDALVISTRLVARGAFLGGLGLTPKEHPSGMGEYIEVDPTGQTEVAGVWAAGNITDPAAQVGGSAAAGAVAGARINADLIEEETLRAVEEYAGNTPRAS